MKKILSIAFKEVSDYFKSPLAYVVLLTVLAVFNVFFFLIIEENREATLRDVFTVMEFIFVFMVPMLTMKTLSEEKSTGTLEFLLTSPIRVSQVVIGKYLGNLIFFTLLVGSTLSFYGILEIYGEPDAMATFIGYLGIWLEGAAFIAIGVLASSLTQNQIIAAFLTYVTLFFLYFSLSMVKYFQGLVQKVIKYACVMTHSENFFAGILQANDCIYFLSIILACLAITRMQIKFRK